MKKLINQAFDALSMRIAFAQLKVDTRPLSVLRKRCADEAADYIAENSQDAVLVQERKALLSLALNEVCVDGLILEFGVLGGNTIRFIADRCKGPVHGFDSFEGLPVHGSGTTWTKKKFDRAGALPKVPSHVTLYKGWFSDTLPGFLNKHQGLIAFAHIDCDIYPSAKTILSSLRPRFVEGSILVFDEYLNFPGWRQHEFKAFHEFIQESGFRYRYLGFAINQAAVMLIKR